MLCGEVMGCIFCGEVMELLVSAVHCSEAISTLLR